MKPAKKNLLGLLLLILFFTFSACNNNTPENFTASELCEGILEMSNNEINQVANENSVNATHEPENSESTHLTRIESSDVIYILPAPRTEGDVSVEQALAERRSRRDFQDRAITAEQLSQILWSAYGITQPRPDAPRGGLRTTPSAGALFPLQIYIVVGNVEGIEPGVYRYISEEHKIVQVIAGDVRNELADAALGQRMLREAPATVAYSADFAVMLPRYGERGIIYTYIEVGHSAQNVYLQAEALGLGTVAVGAFTDSRVAEILNLPENETPLYLMPFGYFN